MSRHSRNGLAVVLAGLAACTPTLNWREVRPEAAGLLAMFPCKPEQFARTVPLAGGRVQLRLASCSAGGATYALSYAKMAEPMQVSAALEQLRRAAADNIGAPPASGVAWTVSGMTPHPLAQRWRLQGHAADAAAVTEQVGLFTKGLIVYQATMLGPRLDTDAVDTFFGALKLSP